MKLSKMFVDFTFCTDPAPFSISRDSVISAKFITIYTEDDYLKYNALVADMSTTFFGVLGGKIKDEYDIFTLINMAFTPEIFW